LPLKRRLDIVDIKRSIESFKGNGLQNLGKVCDTADAVKEIRR